MLREEEKCLCVTYVESSYLEQTMQHVLNELTLNYSLPYVVIFWVSDSTWELFVRVATCNVALNY